MILTALFSKEYKLEFFKWVPEFRRHYYALYKSSRDKNLEKNV